ncbi:unnamed protein product [Pleuronectes platessa]|uniref:Uncharacterized protein n=1 Tax=Pleuronectes platessa TaxID=8262 RepID=A0A9N7UDD9_PLEPL|nr:unnamed protein product [Pleuronectes platessa]
MRADAGVDELQTTTLIRPPAALQAPPLLLYRPRPCCSTGPAPAALQAPPRLLYRPRPCCSTGPAPADLQAPPLLLYRLRPSPGCSHVFLPSTLHQLEWCIGLTATGPVNHHNTRGSSIRSTEPLISAELLQANGNKPPAACEQALQLVSGRSTCRNKPANTSPAAAPPATGHRSTERLVHGSLEVSHLITGRRLLLLFPRLFLRKSDERRRRERRKWRRAPGRSADRLIHDLAGRRLYKQFGDKVSWVLTPRRSARLTPDTTRLLLLSPQRRSSSVVTERLRW